jgi:hypothetical protein
LLALDVGKLRERTKIDRDPQAMYTKDWMLLALAGGAGAAVGFWSFVFGLFLLPWGLGALAVRKIRST